jgi:hypothetical protein
MNHDSDQDNTYLAQQMSKLSALSSKESISRISSSSAEISLSLPDETWGESKFSLCTALPYFWIDIDDEIGKLLFNY